MLTHSACFNFQVSVFSPAPRKYYLNITPGNILQIYPPDSQNMSSSQALVRNVYDRRWLTHIACDYKYIVKNIYFKNGVYQKNRRSFKGIPIDSMGLTWWRCGDVGVSMSDCWSKGQSSSSLQNNVWFCQQRS